MFDLYNDHVVIIEGRDCDIFDLVKQLDKDEKEFYTKNQNSEYFNKCANKHKRVRKYQY